MKPPKETHPFDLYPHIDDYEGKAGRGLFWIEFYMDEARVNSDLFDDAALLRLRDQAGKLADEAARMGDTKTLRDLADILDGKRPKRKRRFTGAQQNVIDALVDYFIEHNCPPESQTELVAHSKQRDYLNSISASTLSDFPIPLPIGKGTTPTWPAEADTVKKMLKLAFAKVGGAELINNLDHPLILKLEGRA